MVVHTCNINARVAETGESRFQGQPRVHKGVKNTLQKVIFQSLHKAQGQRNSEFGRSHALCVSVTFRLISWTVGNTALGIAWEYT